jgi:4-aminobutyrate aminotransferase/(S)-3-amino-2-methylpropionate transaminase
MFACEQLGVVPDVVVTAKGLAGGMVLSAVTGRAEILDAPSEGGIGGTYGGNPVSCAAALAVFDIFAEKQFLARVETLTAKISSTLMTWHEQFTNVGHVRGLGPMQGFELVRDRVTKEPAPEMAKALVKYCYERGLVIMTAGSYGNVVRLLVPLVISDLELQEGLDVMAAGLREVTSRAKV